tara:strand:+ start:218 stop:430 length:213 start_codon:yes stop_codon:yes gene_type:complete
MAETINERLSSQRYQFVRLIDVFVLAPTMVYASTFKSLPDYIRLILLVSGIATLVFNGINYVDIKKEKNG